MPKKQKQKKDENQHDVELNRLVRSSPLPPPHHPHLRSRSPSPSSPHGSTMELPNVPSYPRLPPIISSPSKHLSSPPWQLSGHSNPAFFIEDDSDFSAVSPAGESRILQPVECFSCWCESKHNLKSNRFYFLEKLQKSFSGSLNSDIGVALSCFSFIREQQSLNPMLGLCRLVDGEKIKKHFLKNSAGCVTLKTPHSLFSVNHLTNPAGIKFTFAKYSK